jgi:glycolate oxidase FAD binding subunit
MSAAEEPVDATCRIDDKGPFPVFRPTVPAEVGERIRQARAENHAVFPLGGQTQLDVGLPPDRPGVGIDLRSLDSVIDYPARDMTITVQAGISLARLQTLLAGENQRLPIDVPRSEQSTLGGALAVNLSGPRRYGAGTLRDYVIGITTVNDEGQETRAGGRVVKNVAGYDLCKLHIGALGTLGIISQVTLKVQPRPESQALLALGCESAGLTDLLERLHTSRTRPICLELLGAAAVRTLAGVKLPASAWVVVVGFEESEEAVRWQMQQLIHEVGSRALERSDGVHVLAGASCEPLWQALTDLITPPQARLSFKANLLPSQVAPFCLAAGARPEGVLLHAHAGSGIVRGHVASDLTQEAATAMLEELTRQAGLGQKEGAGNLVLPRCPVPWKKTLPVWGRPRPGTSETWLMRRVKQQLDPQRLFNPGRFLDGI